MMELRGEYGRLIVLVPPLKSDWSILMFVIKRVSFSLLSLVKNAERSKSRNYDSYSRHTSMESCHIASSRLLYPLPLVQNLGII